MSVKIGHAVCDENGKGVNGATGDQTGKEIRVQDWYSSPWNVYLECTDPTMANKAAELMEYICNDPNFGYDMNQRLTGITAILQNGGLIKGAKGEFDCSSLVSACYILAGLDIASSNRTATLRKALLGTGKFVEYTGFRQLSNPSEAKRGGVYLREGHHVAMVLHNDTDVYVEPKRVLKLGIKGEEVKWVQNKLVKAGFNITVDGDFGAKTDRAVKDFQRNNGLVIDGEVGPKTKAVLKRY